MIFLTVAIDLIVQHIRDFLNNRGRGIEQESYPSKDIADKDDQDVSDESGNRPATTKKKTETHSHNMHRPH